jgi:hypothetical protein
MRAKMQVSSVESFQGGAEKVNYSCVTGTAPFGPNGESEDNTFARYSPSGTLTITITNPDLKGTIQPGQKFYVDFTPADA